MDKIKISDGNINCNGVELEYLGAFYQDRGYQIFLKDAANEWYNLFFGFNDNDTEHDTIPIIDDLNETPEEFKNNLNNSGLEGYITIIGCNVISLLRGYGLKHIEIIEDNEKDYGFKILDKICGGLIKRNKRFEYLSEDKKEAISDCYNTINLDNIKQELTYLLEYGKSPVRAKKLLAKYLEQKHGVILRKHTGDIFKLDATGYYQIDIDDLVILLSDDLGYNIVSDKEIKEALSSISTRLEPQYNIIKFNNVLYDIEEMQEIQSNKPIFTLVESKYNFNPDAESKILKKFLYTSLERETEEETQKQVQGVLQIIGYLFTSGNKYTLAPIITGVSGSGKSVFSNILTAIFGADKISGVSLQEMVRDPHSTSAFINKHLNIIRDSSNIVIEDNGMFKTVTGNDPVTCNPKFKNHFDLPPLEVPKLIMVCNNIPRFKDVETPLIERFIIIEFLKKFRDTPQENPNLERDILQNSEEIEWLIYQSIFEYSKITDKQDFNLKLSRNETIKLMDKHTQPINYLLSLVIEEHNPDKIDSDSDGKYPPIVASELNQVLVYLSEKRGVEIEVNNKGEIKPNQLLTAIKKEFDLFDGESVLTVDDYGDTSHKTRKYTTQPQAVKLRANKTSIVDYVRCYPNLIANDKYYEALDEIFN